MTMPSMDKFIPAYPVRTDPSFMEKMVRKNEFRELLIDPVSPNKENTFFYNAQTMVGRWMASWTNNNALFVVWDPGNGKTRAAISVISTRMQYSDHRKALIIADTKTILKAFTDELLEFTGKKKELDARTWVIGKKSQGRSIAATRLLKSGGIQTSTPAFIDHIAKEIGISEYMKDIYVKYDQLVHMTREEAEEDDQWTDLYDAYQQIREELRRRYRDHSIVLDEVHIFRKSNNTDKQSYGKILLLLDALRDICPILFLSATPIVDTWRDLISLLAMLYPVEQRDEIDQDINDEMDIEDLVMKWGRGLISYRTSEGVVPASKPIPTNSDVPFYIERRGEDDELERVELDDDIYPVFMSDYQTLFTAASEATGKPPQSLDSENMGEISSETGVYNWRKYYDFTPPTVSENGVSRILTIDELITESNGKYVPSKTSYINAGTESVFDITWVNERPSTETGLGRYSAKFAELIRMMRYDDIFKGKAGYVHDIWVEYGIKPLAAALTANGWEQYTGVGEVTVGSKPKFAVIHGSNISSTKIDNIIAAFNSEANRDGSVLKLIIGSKKSGISINFTTAQFFIELSSTFNKSVTIQSKGRVYRASSLQWMPKNKRVIYAAVMVALPSLRESSEDIDEGVELYREDIRSGKISESDYYALDDNGRTVTINPYTIEMRLNYLAQSKFDVSQTAMAALRSVSIEEEYLNYRSELTDNITYDLIYSNPKVERAKVGIKDEISRNWNVKINQSSMIQAKAIASLISNKELVVSNYGIPAPVQDVEDFVSSYRGRKAFTPLSLIYNQNFFITDDERSYNTRTVAMAINILKNSPTGEYDFYNYISTGTPSSVRAFLLEMSLSRDTKILSTDDMRVLDSRKELILSLYSMAWNSFSPSTLVHILWYLIRSSSYVSKLGITSNPEGRSRILSYDKKTNISTNMWRYERNSDTESVYLSPLARNIYDQEMTVIEKSKHLGFYVHFSLADGQIRVRQINLEDLRRSKFFTIKDAEVATFISTLLSQASPIDSQDINEKVYYAAKEKGILIIR